QIDNAAFQQKPKAEPIALAEHHSRYNGKVHRGIHTLSEEATDEYEKARHKIQAFINAESPSELIFVRNTTEAINLVAYSFGERLQEGDEILLSEMEHHSNLVPWQLLAD